MNEHVQTYIQSIQNDMQKERMIQLIEWILKQYPMLELVYKWRGPMFIHHNTFILGLSVAKHHIALAPDTETMIAFKARIKAVGYDQSMMFIKIKNEQPLHFDLIQSVIDTNILEKQHTQTFWRK